MKQHKILHVDDDIDDLHLFEEAIQSVDAGFQVVQAHNGIDGLKKLQKMKEEATLPCLIVLDLNMPGVDGKQAFGIIKNDEKLSSVPIVILSTSNSAIDKLYFSRKNVEYITKPVSFDHLIQVATKLVGYCKN